MIMDEYYVNSGKLNRTFFGSNVTGLSRPIIGTNCVYSGLVSVTPTRWLPVQVSITNAINIIIHAIAIQIPAHVLNIIPYVYLAIKIIDIIEC